VWLEYVTSAPGGRGERVRREVFDLLKGQREAGRVPAALSLSDADVTERGLALLTRTSSLVLTSTPHIDAVDKAALASVAENREPFIALVYLAAGRDDPRVPIALGRSVRRIDLLAMAALRELWSRHAGLTYVDRTQVLSSHLIRVPRGDAAPLQFATDIVMHRVGVVPGAPLDARLARLEQGVLDTLVETTFSSGDEVHNTFRHFAGPAGSTRGAWRAVTGPADGGLLAGLPAEEQARIHSAVRQGHVVVASTTPFALGDRQYASWWRIDPSDGTTLGIGYRGWGQDTGEYVKGNTLISHAVKKTSQEAGETTLCKVATAVWEIGMADTMEIDIPTAKTMPLRAPDLTQELPIARIDDLKRTDRLIHKIRQSARAMKLFDPVLEAVTMPNIKTLKLRLACLRK
jgi:hypothetical protein